MEEITLLEVLLDPNNYNLYPIDDSSPTDKIVEILGTCGAKDFYARKRKEMTLSTHRTTFRSIRVNLSKIVKRRSFNGSTAYITAQYESGCDHKNVTPEIVECECYKFLCRLFSGVNVVVKSRGSKKEEYRLKVEA